MTACCAKSPSLTASANDPKAATTQSMAVSTTTYSTVDCPDASPTSC